VKHFYVLLFSLSQSEPGVEGEATYMEMYISLVNDIKFELSFHEFLSL
jgi:hypothetical protein